jgi:hypothetical protein
MWDNTEKYKKSVVDYNAELLKITGSLNDKEAKISLAKFLRHNIGFTVELLSGVKLVPVQEIVLRGMLNRNFSMFVAGRGVGKTSCYTPDTKLLTKEHGLISITDLFPNIDFSLSEERIEEINNLHFWDGHQWSLVERMLIQRAKKCATVTTSRGFSLGGSTNHLVKCLDEKTQKIKFKRYHELTTGDHICIERKSVEWGTPVLTKDEAYFTGILIGDGSVGEKANGFRVTSMDEEIKDFCLSYGAKSLKKYDSKAQDFAWGKEFAAKFLDKVKLKRGLSYDKFIPQTILSSSESLKECLSGLFDTDGCVEWHGKKISFCSVSKRLINQVQDSLLLFGIVSKKRIKKTKSKFGKAYILNISGQNALLFLQRIGFKIKRKQVFVEKFRSLVFNTNVDVIPGAKRYIMDVKKDYKLSGDFSKEWISKKRTSQKELTYKSLIDILDLFRRGGIKDCRLDIFDEILKENFFFDKIQSIDQYEENCLDFYLPNGNMYWSNGFISHNTFLAAIYCILQCIFEPNTKILIAGPTFRTARFIFNNIEKLVESKGADLLAQAFSIKPSKRNDQNEWKINGGTVTAIPLNGEKIRGFRANILLLDEYLLLPEELIKTVLMPFLVAPQNMAERIEIRELEDRLISEGMMREEDRIVFENTSKMIALSSASYTFENLYKTYKEWVHKIQEPEVGEASYFIAQLSYEAMPKDMIDRTIIEEAQDGGSSNASFLREYCAQFTDGSDSYFSAKKMYECTIPDGEMPTTRIKGGIGKKYILGIDPSFSNSPSSDYFAMSVMEINHETKTSTLVHSYAVAGGDLKNHIKYLSYLLSAFDMEMIVIDSAGYQFIDSYNESEYCHKELSFIDFETDKEGSDYIQAIIKAKGSYNKESGSICIKQNFTSSFIRRANEYLQASIDHKRVWFASKITANDTAFSKTSSQRVDMEMVGHPNMLEFIEFQDAWIYQTKKQCSLVEVKTTAKGTQSFDLPQHLKRSTSANKARKDNYTTLMLGCWGVKCYFDMTDYRQEQVDNTFVPFFV